MDQAATVTFISDNLDLYVDGWLRESVPGGLSMCSGVGGSGNGVFLGSRWASLDFGVLF